MYECTKDLDHQSLDLELDSIDLAREFLVLVRSDTGSDDRPSDATGATKCSFGLNEDVGHVLSIACVHERLFESYTEQSHLLLTK